MAADFGRLREKEAIEGRGEYGGMVVLECVGLPLRSPWGVGDEGDFMEGGMRACVFKGFKKEKAAWGEGREGGVVGYFQDMEGMRIVQDELGCDGGVVEEERMYL